MNHRNTAIKRILADVKELQKHPSSRYYAVPLEENMFEWHFTIRGPEDTPFAGGVYHGRILLPAEYPFKPPNIVFLTKNGRFEVGTKICLSISAYHEETWQPAWGVRTMLEALISFLPSEGAGAIGALDWSVAERQRLARESLSYCCPQCGSPASLLPAPSSSEAPPDPSVAEQVRQLHLSGPARQSSERISVTRLVSDMALLGGDGGLGAAVDTMDLNGDGVPDGGMEMAMDMDGDGVADNASGELGVEGGAIAQLPPNTCDIDNFDDAGAPSADMHDRTMDELGRACEDAQDNVDHVLAIHPPLGGSPTTPSQATLSPLSARSTRAAKYTNHNVDAASSSDAAAPPPADNSQDPPTAVPVPAQRPLRVLQRRAPGVPRELPPVGVRRGAAVGMGRVARSPWRRRLDQVLDVLIVIVSAAIVSLAWRILFGMKSFIS